MTSYDLLQEIRNRHWLQVMSVTNSTFQLEANFFRLEHLLDIGLMKYVVVVSDLPSILHVYRLKYFAFYESNLLVIDFYYCLAVEVFVFYMIFCPQRTSPSTTSLKPTSHITTKQS